MPAVSSAKVKSKKLKCIVCLKANEVVETPMSTYAPSDATSPSQLYKKLCD